MYRKLYTKIADVTDRLYSDMYTRSINYIDISSTIQTPNTLPPVKQPAYYPIRYATRLRYPFTVLFTVPY